MEASRSLQIILDSDPGGPTNCRSGTLQTAVDPDLDLLESGRHKMAEKKKKKYKE
jgi:hypothetical protein